MRARDVTSESRLDSAIPGRSAWGEISMPRLLSARAAVAEVMPPSLRTSKTVSRRSFSVRTLISWASGPAPVSIVAKLTGVTVGITDLR